MKNTILKYIFSIVLALAICFVLLISIFALMSFVLDKSLAPVTDISKYPALISDFKKSCPYAVAHFPNVVPPEAKNVEFYFSQGFLQGDSILNLKFETSPEIINAYYDQFIKDATKIERTDHFKDISGNFEKFYFQEDPDNTPEHHPSYGVIIEKEKCIIVFWAYAI